EPQQHRLQGEQAAGLQGIALQRHRQREDELEQDEPGDDGRRLRSAQPQHHRIEQQEADDGQLVPARRAPQKEIAVRGEHEQRAYCAIAATGAGAISGSTNCFQTVLPPLLLSMAVNMRSCATSSSSVARSTRSKPRGRSTAATGSNATWALAAV